jgi:glycosyltransferase involved in cell wall biosynthesis
MAKVKLGIYAIHPIMYQVPIFAALEKRIVSAKLELDSLVYFGDDLSLRNVFFEEIQVIFKPDTPNLLRGYSYQFLKNYARDSRSGFLSRMNLGLLRELRTDGVSVLLVHGYESFTSWIAIFGAKLLGIKVIWRGEAVRRDVQSSWKRWLKKLTLGALFKSCNAVMYSCSGNKDYLKDFGVPESRMFPIPCAIDNEFFRAEYQRLLPQRNQARQSLGIDKNDCVVLFCARFTQRKRPMDLIEAMSQMQDDRLVALFVGDGPERKRLEETAMRYGVRTLFVGFKNQSDVSQYYCISDVAAVISSYDPSPKAMNEAMNFNLPIIATDVIGTVPDLVRNGDNGFVIQVGRVDQLVEALRQFITIPHLANRMGVRSQEIVVEWNYEADVDGILTAIDYVLSN